MYLSVGLNCVDIVSFTTKYPLEDSDQRCNKQVWERGGNASNNASVLADIGARVEFYGTLANDHLLKFFQEDMSSRGIINNHCPVIDCCQSPASVVICSEESGSRTIVHNNGTLPELTADQFAKDISLENYSWIHFEGRNEVELSKILPAIQAFNANSLKSLTTSTSTKTMEEPTTTTTPNYTSKILPVSIEVEKKRECLGSLLQFADVVFIGKEFASMRGAKDSGHAAQIFSNELAKGVLVICPWGEDGASFCIAGDRKENIKKVHSFPPPKILDSLGAGDTFCSAVIYALNKKHDLETSVRFGCQVAGAKLGIFGFKNIRESILSIPDCQKILKE